MSMSKSSLSTLTGFETLLGFNPAPLTVSANLPLIGLETLSGLTSSPLSVSVNIPLTGFETLSGFNPSALTGFVNSSPAGFETLSEDKVNRLEATRYSNISACIISSLVLFKYLSIE